jgi:predicted LPLAT superfamily acyltransferase
MAEQAWEGTTFGTGFMHRWLIGALRHTDVRLWYAFAAVCVIPFCVIFSPATRHAYSYFRHRHHYGCAKSLWKSYVNLVLFSQVVIDRFAMFAGKRFKLRVENYDLFKSLAAKDPGFVMLSAHVGCYEMAGYELVSDRKPFNALVFAGEKESIMQGRQRLFKHSRIHMIPARKDMSHLFEIDRALADGEIMSIPADRALGSHKTVTVTLLGAKAQLPSGPFSVAAMRGLDVITVNVTKTSITGYTAYVKALNYDKEAPRKQQIQQLADGYASELDCVLKKYPEQWYNYFDFWNEQ